MAHPVHSEQESVSMTRSTKTTIWTDSNFESCLWPGASLRNRTVDLLLTMNRRAVTQPLVRRDDQAEREPTPALAITR